MRLSTLTHLGFELNAALDTGRFQDVSIEAVKSAIDDGRLFHFLENTLGGDVDLSIFGDAERSELTTQFQDFVSAIRERKKMGIERNGLNLLVAYVFQAIQQHPDMKRRQAAA